MAIQYPDKAEFEGVLKNGGKVKFIIDENDIDSTGNFKNAAIIKPYLKTGFEIPPSPIIEDPVVAANISVYGDDWTLIIAQSYMNGAKIIYKQLNDGTFEATIKK